MRRTWELGTKETDDFRGITNAKLNMSLCEEHTTGKDRIVPLKDAFRHGLVASVISID